MYFHLIRVGVGLGWGLAELPQAQVGLVLEPTLVVLEEPHPLRGPELVLLAKGLTWSVLS